MKEEVKRWIEQAEHDLKAAKDSSNAGNFGWAAFQAQQTAEKSLKAIILNRDGKIRKIHDLIELGRDADLPENILNKLKELTQA